MIRDLIESFCETLVGVIAGSVIFVVIANIGIMILKLIDNIGPSVWFYIYGIVVFLIMWRFVYNERRRK